MVTRNPRLSATESTDFANLCDWLNKAGLKVKNVSVPLPEDKNAEFIFTIRRNERDGVIEIAQGPALIYAYVEEGSWKQAVLRVVEEKRTVRRTYDCIQYYPAGSKQASDPDEYFYKMHFPVSFPSEDDVQYKLISSKIKAYAAFVPTPSQGGTFCWEVTVEATTPHTETCFLIGQDEKAQFISCLPKVVKSVHAAHKALRPKGVTKEAKRQGEWFFQPVKDNNLIRTLDAHWDNDSYNEAVDLEEQLGYTGAEGSHFAITDFLGGVYYTPGPVWANNNHHSLLHLGGWHRIYRNNEITNPTDEVWD